MTKDLSTLLECSSQSPFKILGTMVDAKCYETEIIVKGSTSVDG